MDQVHFAIGVAGVLAMIVLLANSVTYIGGLVADETSDNISNLVNRGSPVADQLTSVEGEPTLMEGHYVNATCSAVQSIANVVGPLLPRLPSLAKLKDEEKDAATKTQPEAVDEKMAWVEPPGEERGEEQQ
ncbi:hypothetical protein KR038_011730 [Drosophila bunnanda]|nr:hypothetical protein KR038_011730 [Drosophila bunnanda]